MKRTNFWLGLTFFVVLLALAVYINQRHKMSQRKSQLRLDQIEKIELSHNGQEVILVKDGTNWLVDGLIPVRLDALEQMYKVIAGMKKRGRVNEHILFDIRKELMNSPEVKIWSNGKIVKSFFIGKPVSDSSANYYMPSDDMLAYVVYVPGIKGDLQHFFVADPNYWRDAYLLKGILPGVEYYSFCTHARNKKIMPFTKRLKKDLSEIKAQSYIDEAGLVDSLQWAKKHNKYLCQIEFFNNEKIPVALITCFRINHDYMALYEDFGGNAVIAVLGKDDVDILRNIKH